MRGSELARQVRAKLPQVAVLLMSGYSAELLQAPEASADAWELLRKPFERDELARAIVRALASRPPEASVQR
jgi:CheY-like chemotaxis protein